MTDRRRSLYDRVNYYTLDTWKGDKVSGRFYEPQLQKVRALPKEWRVTKKLTYKRTRFSRGFKSTSAESKNDAVERTRKVHLLRASVARHGARIGNLRGSHFVRRQASLRYGQVHMDPMGISNPPSITKLDLFHPDLVLAAQVFYNKQIPFFRTRLIWMADYVKDATKTLFRLNRKDANRFWNILRSPIRPSTHYSLRLSAESEYNLGESLAVMMGFLEPDPNRPGQTRIVPHNSIYVNTGNGTRAEWQVTRLDIDHIGIQNEDILVGGVHIRLNNSPSLI